MTIGQYSKYYFEPFDLSKELEKKEQGDEEEENEGRIKLCSHVKDCFDENPYGFKKPLPPKKVTKSSKGKPKPFKPSSPAKLFGACMAVIFGSYPPTQLILT